MNNCYQDHCMQAIYSVLRLDLRNADGRTPIEMRIAVFSPFICRLIAECSQFIDPDILSRMMAQSFGIL